MTTERFEEIKENIQLGKDTRIKAEGKLEDLETRLQEEFDVATIEEATTTLNSLNKDVETLTKKEGKLEKEIETLLETMEDEDED